MKKFFGALLTGFALFFSIPTVLILASWNAIPGDTLYSVKSSLEDVALALTKNTPMATAFSINFTDRRFDEAVKLLDKEGSSVGYQLLVAEAQQTRSLIIDKQDAKNGALLVLKIEEYQADIEAKQVEVQNQANLSDSKYYNPTPTPSPTPPPSPGEGKKVTIDIPVEVLIEEEDTEKLLDNLKEAYENLEDIKIEVEDELPDMEAEAPASGPDSSSMDDESPEEEESPAEERNDNNKNKDKEKPPKDKEEDLEE
jgi:hypothetical protein